MQSEDHFQEIPYNLESLMRYIALKIAGQLIIYTDYMRRYQVPNNLPHNWERKLLLPYLLSPRKATQ